CSTMPRSIARVLRNGDIPDFLANGDSPGDGGSAGERVRRFEPSRPQSRFRNFLGRKFLAFARRSLRAFTSAETGRPDALWRPAGARSSPIAREGSNLLTRSPALPRFAHCPHLLATAVLWEDLFVRRHRDPFLPALLAQPGPSHRLLVSGYSVWRWGRWCAPAGAGNANSSAAARGDQRAGTLWWFNSTCALAIPSSNALTALARRLALGNAKNCRPAIFEAREI